MLTALQDQGMADALLAMFVVTAQLLREVAARTRTPVEMERHLARSTGPYLTELLAAYRAGARRVH